MKTLARGAIICLCALALSGVCASALAQRGGWRDENARRPRVEKIVEFLELSETQVDQLEELREEGRSQMADLRKEMMRVKNEIRGEMLEDNPDVSALKRLLAKKGEIRTDMEIARLERRLEMREILTDDQLDKLMMHRGRAGRRGFDGAGHRFGRGRMGHGRGAGRGGPMMGLELEEPGEDCFGFGPGPYLWCE